MCLLVAILFTALCACDALDTKRDTVTFDGTLDSLYTKSSCPHYTNAIDAYRAAMANFTIEIFKNTAALAKFHYVVCPQSMWLNLAGIAEGADPYNQDILFQLLTLPKDPCLREKIYKIARSRFNSASDINLVSKRTLVIDEGVTLNPKWHNYVSRHSLLEVITAPIKRDSAAAANIIRHMTSASFPKLNLQGKSVLLDTVDYNGFWTTAFSDPIVKRAPFYSPSGQQIGAVDLMRVKLRARIGYDSTLQSKVIEIPIGKKSRYSMIITLLVGDADLTPVVKNLQSSIIDQVIGKLKDSEVPMDVAIPRFSLKSELDLKSILQDLGITNLWTDPAVTRYISDPPVLPGNYIQRVSVTVNVTGVNSPKPDLGPYGGATDGIASKDWFIADRPFMFGIYDVETYSCIVATMYTQPTYPL